MKHISKYSKRSRNENCTVKFHRKKASRLLKNTTEAQHHSIFINGNDRFKERNGNYWRLNKTEKAWELNRSFKLNSTQKQRYYRGLGWAQRKLHSSNVQQRKKAFGHRETKVIDSERKLFEGNSLKQEPIAALLPLRIAPKKGPGLGYKSL